MTMLYLNSLARFFFPALPLFNWKNLIWQMLGTVSALQLGSIVMAATV